MRYVTWTHWHPKAPEVFVRARDLVVDYPAVRDDTPAIDAAKLLAGQDLPGLIVTNASGQPTTILPGTEVLKMAVPRYVQDDPTLAHVIDDATSDIFVNALGAKTVAQLLPDTPRELPVVRGDATLLEIAALMARSRSPLVAVVDDRKLLLGAVTLDALLDKVLS
jgi:predicted transcriptional regulator